MLISFLFSLWGCYSEGCYVGPIWATPYGKAHVGPTWSMVALPIWVANIRPGTVYPGGGGGEGTLIFSYIRRIGSFFFGSKFF